MSTVAENGFTTTRLDQLSDEVGKLRSEVARLRFEREQDLEEIRAAMMMAEFVLSVYRSIDHQEIAGHGPADSHKEFGPVKVTVGGVMQGQKALDGDALN